jgi:hypothetical protein
MSLETMPELLYAFETITVIQWTSQRNQARIDHWTKKITIIKDLKILDSKKNKIDLN